MRYRHCLMLLGAVLLALAGCAGKGQVIDLDVRAIPSDTEMSAKRAEAPTIAVLPFDDLRPDKSKLGTRTHLWGGVTHFNVPQGKVGDVMAQVTADYLTEKGWRAKVMPAAKAADSGGITLTGKVQEFSANAKSRFMNTEITVKSVIAVHAANPDGSTVRMTLNGDGTHGVFWFEPEDVRNLLNDVLKDSLNKLLSDTKMEDGRLRLK
jgi:uncharacterized lipoprotein YajG